MFCNHLERNVSRFRAVQFLVVLAGSSIGHRIKFQRRPQSPPIGGLPQGTSYDFVTEEEPEMDERLLQALQAAADAAGTSPGAVASASGRQRKRHREEERGRRDRDVDATDAREREKHRDGDERDARRYDRSSAGGREQQNSPDVLDRNHEHQEDRQRYSRRDDVDDDRWSMQSQERDETVQREHKHSSQRPRTDHERRGGSQRDRRDDSRSQARPDKHKSASDSDGEQEREVKDRRGKHRGREKERSHKAKKSKKRSKEKKDDATFEDAVRYIAEQGLSAEDVLNELRGRKIG